jgi:hypothetical protein
MKKQKIQYRKPEILSLGAVSSAEGADPCAFGGTATADCNAGVTAGGPCTSGTSAVGTCDLVGGTVAQGR